MSVPPKKKEKSEEQKRWEAEAYSPERLQAVVEDRMTLRELHRFSGEEMRQMASVGYQLYEQGRFKEAKIVFEGLSVLDPQETYYLSAVGAIYVAEENLPMAEQVFNAALTINPKDTSAYVNRGEVYLRQGKLVEAAADLKKVVELDPEVKDPMTLRARALAQVALEGFARAKAEVAGGKKPAAEKPKSAPAKSGPTKGAPKKHK